MSWVFVQCGKLACQNIKIADDFTAVGTMSSINSNTKQFGEKYFYLANLYIFRQSTFIRNMLGVKYKELDIWKCGHG